MATLIKSNGVQQEVSPKNGTDFSLEELQGFVGGYIEIIYLDDTKIMVVNEEGKLNGLPYNERATAMVYFLDAIVGDVLVCESKEVK